jgi:hypothetical protein
MKTTLLCCATCLLMLWAAAAPAATYQWSVDGFARVLQILADGKGGCVVLGNASSGERIVWVNQKGAIVYDKTLTMGMSLGIVTFDGKTLVYHYQMALGTLIVVDKKGIETTVSDTDYNLNGLLGTFPYQPVNGGDKKGFFTVQDPVMSGTMRVARYTYK